MRNVPRCNFECADSEFIEEVRAVLIERRGQEINVQTTGLLVQRPKCVEREFQFPEQFLEVWLVLGMDQCRRSCGSQPIGTKRLKFHSIRAGPFCGTNQSKRALFRTAVVQSSLGNYINAI